MYAVFKVDAKTKKRTLESVVKKEELERHILMMDEYFPDDRFFAIPAGKAEADEDTLTGRLRASQDSQRHLQ